MNHVEPTRTVRVSGELLDRLRALRPGLSDRELIDDCIRFRLQRSGLSRAQIDRLRLMGYPAQLREMADDLEAAE